MAEIQGHRIKDLRRELGMTQDKLAERIKIKKLALLSYETGKRNPEMKTLVKLARELACTTDYLLGLSDNRLDEIAIEENENWGRIKYAMRRCSEEHRKIIAEPISEFMDSSEQIVSEPEGDKLRQLAIEILRQITLCYECVSEINAANLESEEKAAKLRVLDELLNAAMRVLLNIGEKCRSSTDSPKTHGLIKFVSGVLDDRHRLIAPNKKTLDSIWLQLRDKDISHTEVTTNADTEK